MATQNIENELLNLEKKFWQALKDKDIDAAVNLTDDPCIVVGSSGVGRIDRRAFAEMVKSAPFTLNDFEIKGQVEVQSLSDDIAVLAYQVHEELTVDGKPVSLDAAESSTWIRRNGSWLCTLHTEALFGDPFGRDKH